MKNRLAKLINVKSIVTIVLTAVFSVLSLKGRITPESFDNLHSGYRLLFWYTVGKERTR